MSEIRSFARPDAEAVAALFQRTFRAREGPPPPGVAAYFSAAYLDHPGFDPEIASLVHVNDAGRVTGFVGVFPTRFAWDGRRLRGAVAGTLMVEEPAREPFAGARLLRAVARGPQDLTVSETTNPVSRALWERLGASVVPQMSLDWLRILQPAAAAVSLFAERHRSARLLMPFARLGDAVCGGWTRRALPPPEMPDRVTVEARPSDADFAEVVLTLSRSYALRPDWSRDDLLWRLAQAAQKERYGPPVRAIVRGTAGELLGCYLFHGMRGGTGRVLQVLAGEKNAGVVLDCLLHAARAAGLAALRGRTTPRFMPALLERNCVFLNRGTTIVHARDSGVRAAAFGDALILGLAGESWTRLIGDDFA